MNRGLAELFRFGVSPWELVVRGTAMYWFLFVLFRFVLRRDVGSLAIADILLLVLIADASQNAMSGGYDSVAEGMVLVGTIAAWNYALDWAVFRWPVARKLLEPRPLPLVRRGRVMRGNLRHELLTVDDLRGKLREQGIDDLTKVKAVYMESDGSISVVPADDAPAPKPPRRRH